MMFETARVGTGDRRRHRAHVLAPGVLFLLSCLVSTSAAQDREPAPKDAVRTSYPRINLSTGYEVISSWPAGHKDLAWGAVAGIAIGPEDQVWTFNRGTVPVQVYSANGELLRSWGEGLFREPHQVRIDRQGDVWLVDSGQHCVRKYTPDGKLQLTLGTPGEPGEDSTSPQPAHGCGDHECGRSLCNRRLW